VSAWLGVQMVRLCSLATQITRFVLGVSCLEDRHSIDMIVDQNLLEEPVA
jgi:hypothetical protein